MPNINEYIAHIQNTDQWQSAEVKAAQINRLDEAAKNTILTDKQFAETYQYRIITEKLPPILRKAGLNKNADECQNSPDLGNAVGNAKKASNAVLNAALDAASNAASNAAYGAAYSAAYYAPNWAAYDVPKDQKDAVLTRYVDLMVDVLQGGKAEVKADPFVAARAELSLRLAQAKENVSRLTNALEALNSL